MLHCWVALLFILYSMLTLLRPVYTCNFRCGFQCDFRLWTDVKEWDNNECSEYMFLHLNIPVWFTRSHPSSINWPLCVGCAIYSFFFCCKLLVNQKTVNCRVPPKRLRFQIRINALIQTTYCIVLWNSLTLLNDECTKTHSFIHMGDEEKLLIIWNCILGNWIQ